MLRLWCSFTCWSATFFSFCACGKIEDVGYSSINDFEWGNLRNLEYVILQEKLDGCNFRLIFDHKTEQVSFGSRNFLLDDDFHGFYRIKDSLVEKVKKISTYKTLNGKDFIIFGELTGYNSKGAPIIPRIMYDFPEKTIKYFAYDILVPDKINTSADENKGDTSISKFYENFLEVQDWLKECDFDVIPYEILKPEDYTFDRIKKFRSILFNHEDVDKTEGYILRLKYKGIDHYKIMKLKPENFPELRANMTRERFKNIAVKPKKNITADDKFLDYISKVPYLNDYMMLKPEYMDACVEGYQKETNATTKNDFIVFYKSLCLYCNEKPNFGELFAKFNAAVSRNNNNSTN